MNFFHPSVFLVLLLLVSCGTKKLTQIRFDYDDTQAVNYGCTFNVDVIGTYSNGKEKKLNTKKELGIECSGAFYSSGKVTVDGYPSQFGEDLIQLSAVYLEGNDSLTAKTNIAFNYKGQLKLTFHGEDGQPGTDGGDGGTALLFRDGKDGDNGQIGNNGANGATLEVKVWQDFEAHLYRMTVQNLETSTTYYYNYKDLGEGILIDVQGGRGGRGGNGGDGGNGKDGKEKDDDKIKSAGSGGNGGHGGDGGVGGNGGIVYLYLHTNAELLQSKIAVYNFGGPGGEGGSPGKGGNAGTPLEGQDSQPDGSDGVAGVEGDHGNQGPVAVITIKAFDF